MKYIDTHAHLTSSYYNTGTEAQEVYERAVQGGVEIIINAGTDMQSSRMVVNDKQSMPHTYPAVGIHPLDIDKKDVDFNELESLASLPTVVAIGEIGLDYYHKNAPAKERQIVALEKQLAIALKVHKPVLIHVRNSITDMIAILKQSKYRRLTGVIHTFSGNLEEANEFIKMGFKISFSGVITFPNGNSQREIAASIPLNAILTETDSPFLTPVPNRGQRNEPLNVIYVVAEIARSRNLSEVDIQKQIEQNTYDLFGIK